MLWKDMRGRTKEIHKELQYLDPLCSPHLEEKLIGGNIDLNFLSLFPQRYARIMGGTERGASFPRSIMDGERGENELTKEEKGRGIYPSHKNSRYNIPGRIIWPSG
jgi:hypothetical protein